MSDSLKSTKNSRQQVHVFKANKMLDTAWCIVQYFFHLATANKKNVTMIVISLVWPSQMSGV